MRSVNVPLVGRPDFTVTVLFGSRIDGGGCEEVEASDEVDVVNGFVVGGAITFIVSSCSSALLKASDPSPSVMATSLSTSDSSSSGIGTRSNTDPSLCDEDEDEDDKELVFCFHSFRIVSLVFVSVHSSVSSHVRRRGVVPVGMSSLVPWSERVCVVW